MLYQLKIKKIVYHPILLHSWCFAIALYGCCEFYATRSVEQNFEIPCCFYNITDETVLQTIEAPSSITIKLAGLQHVLSQWSTYQPALHLDASKFDSCNVIDVVDHLFLPEGVRILALSPSSFCIKVNNTLKS